MALTRFKSQLIADVGISMGDEGKGRLIPEVIAELQAETGWSDAVGVVLKVNGGANSGHTAGGLKLNLLPAGVVAKEVPILALGAGVVADPRKLCWEGEPLEARGYQIFSRLLIDERCMVSDLSHRLLDLAWEHYREHVLGGEPRGSTGRGITPAYQDEAGQFQLYFGDLPSTASELQALLEPRFARAVATIRYVCQVPPEVFSGFFLRLTEAETRANAAALADGLFSATEFDFTRFCGAEPYSINLAEVATAYQAAVERVRGCIGDVRMVIRREVARGRFLVGEFGQSFWLDKRHGFTPNVTASHTYAPELFQSAGLPVQPLHTIGCAKAYDTKVGTHVFLTEMDHAAPLAVKLRRLEFGTSTGRQRMVGWFDAVEKGDALRFGGFDDLVINKLDALSADHGGPADLLVCYAYGTPEGGQLVGVPRQDCVRRGLKPVYARLAGWATDLAPMRHFGQLPSAAQHYLAFCLAATVRVAHREDEATPPSREVLLQLATEGRLPNLRYVGVGPEPSQIITDVPTTEQLLNLVDWSLFSDQ